MKSLIVLTSVVLSLFVGIQGLSVVELSSANTTSKKSAGTQRITIQQLQQKIFEEMRERIKSADMELNVQVLFPKTPLEVPAGSLTLRIPQDRFGDLTGRRAFRVQVVVDTQLIKTVSVVASVTARTEVLMPIRWIKLHEVLHARDFIKQKVNLRTLHQDVLVHVKDIIGKQATRSLPPHQPLRSSFVTDPPLIHKGDRVMIEVRRGGLFVQTLGIAKASGLSGELITVTNQTSGRDILATVLASGVVEVRF